MKIFPQFLYLLLISCWLGVAAAQPSVLITYVNPEEPNELEVCDSSLFEVTLTNSSMDPVTGITVTIELPEGVEYNTGTLVNATEFDLTDLSSPVFSIPELTPSEVHTFFFFARASCELIDDINAAQLFSNTITANYDGGSSTLTTDPYDIETALLVTTGITNQIINGSKDEQFIRTISIRNTRLGALSSFTFHDIHSVGIEVTSPNGTDVSSIPFTLELLLGANDFMQIGDNDEFFEHNETIIITENILITDCGVDVNFANSVISAEWGCDNTICQVTTPITAVVNVQPSDLVPVLEFVPTAGLPTCYCADEAVPQSLMITNTGSEPANDIVLVIESIELAASLDSSSFQVDSSGFITPWEPLFNNTVDLSACNPDIDPGFLTAIISYPELGIGESITLSWDVLYCSESCGRVPRSAWEYDYGFYKSCPPNPFIHMEDILVENTDSSFTTSLSNLNMGSLTDNSVSTLEYSINSDFLISSEGSYQLEIIFDCAFEWLDSDLFLGGQSPIIDVLDADTVTIVTATYDLPFSGNDLSMEFDLLFLCNEDCQEVLCVDSLVTSCEESCESPPSPLQQVNVNVNTYLSTMDNCPTACGLLDCQEIAIDYDCENIEFCIDTIPGYLRFDFKMFRTNFGTADINDDRIPDPGNAIDTSLIRTNRAIAGDTIRTVLAGMVVDDYSPNGFANAYIKLNFAAPDLLTDVNSTLLTAAGFAPFYTALRIFDSSSGTYYECDSGIPIDTSEFPEEFYYHYILNPAGLTDCGIPDDFRYNQGDSIILISDYRIGYNIVKQYPQEPFTSIINFVGSPSVILYNNEEPSEFFNCNCGSPLIEISGYRYNFFNGIFAIPPCDSSSYSGNSFFSIELGEGNFFPYEHRNLAILPEWVISTPAFIQPVETKVTRMEMQDQILLYSEVFIDPVFSNGDWSYDLLAFQDPLPDEGFSFIFQYKFESECSISGVNPMELKPQLIFNPSLPEPENPLDTFVYSSSALRGLIPNLNLQAFIYNVTSFDNKARFDFEINNSPTTVASSMSGPADFCWLQPISATGDVVDFQLFNAESGFEYPSVNGIFQIGSIVAEDTTYFQLIGTNLSCEMETVSVRYGWSCDPYENSIATPCYQKNANFTVISPPAELELEVESPNAVFALCDTIDYHTIEIFNAQLGAAYDLILRANLPQGLQVIPGSSQIAYPTGTTFMNVADPTEISGGVVQWNISTLNDSIAANGLAGISSMPNHSVSLRFKSFTSCDFIAESYIIFTTNANQNCEESTNTLSEAGERIRISGVAPPYETSISLNPHPEVSCENEMALNISISADALTTLGDSVFITLPLGIFYVAGSYNPVSNTVPAEPILFNNNGQQILKWPLLSGISAGSQIDFSLTIEGFDSLDCGTQILLIQTVAPANAFCVEAGFGCDLLIETGSVFFGINIERPAFELSDFELTLNPFLGSMEMSYELNITNNGSNANPPVIVDFYLDNDGNGILSPGDTWLFDDVVNSVIESDSTITISGSVPINDEFCSIIAVIDPEKHCACQSDQIGISLPIDNIIHDEFLACAMDSIMIGFTGENGHFYQWVPSTGLDCPTCPLTMIGLENNTSNILTLNYTLTEETGNGCLINNRFMIDVYPQPEITNQSDILCAGDSIELTASDGVSYQWDGPGIIDPSLQSQIVSPLNSSNYTVTITDVIGCEGVDSIFLQVLPLPPINAGTDTTFCEGMTGQLQSDFYPNYTYNWSPPTQLSNPTTHDPFILVEIATTYFLTITDENGCQNTDMVFVDFAESPDLIVSVDTTICDGQSITLQASGADTYEWSPVDFLSCSNCAITEANPIETITYTVNGMNNFGCNSSTTITVTVVDGINTFDTLSTCEGVPLEIFGELISDAGDYCETSSTVNGCDSTHCITLKVDPVIETTEFASLCEGDSLFFNEMVYTESGTYCADFTASNGCDSTHCINIIFEETPVVTEEDFLILQGDLIQLSLPPGYMYQWSPPEGLSCVDCPNPVANPSVTTTYIVLVTDEESGCTATSSVSVTVAQPPCEEPYVFFPNAFTPNGDGQNDELCLRGINVTEVHFIIYNRWGEKMFESNSQGECWDGTFAGKELGSDVYGFYLRVRCGNGEEFTKKGNVTILK